MRRSPPAVKGVHATAPRPTVLGAALVAGAVALPLLLLWAVATLARAVLW